MGSFSEGHEPLLKISSPFPFSKGKGDLRGMGFPYSTLIRVAGGNRYKYREMGLLDNPTMGELGHALQT